MADRHIQVSLRLAFLTERESPVPPVSVLMTSLRARKSWDCASIYPSGSDFPRLSIAFYEGQGFVLQCFENAGSLGDILVECKKLSRPQIEIELGGQALERWPSELFVSSPVAEEAVDYFLKTGAESPHLHWVRIDEFPRDTIWESSKDREAWENSKNNGTSDA